MKEKFSIGDILIYLFLGIFCLSIVVSFLHLFSTSLSPSHIATKGGLHLYPKEITIDNYKKVVESKFIWIGYANTIGRTIVGTVVSLFFTAMSAYALSKKFFPHRSFWTLLIVFTMFFSGGMIPGYIVIANMLKLKDTYWSVLLPGAISAYNMMIVKNFFQGIPQELEDSAAIDGCNDLGILWKIVLPLSLPVLATFGLFYAVGHWNSYFGAMIYMSGARDKWPLQVLLREIIILSNASAGDMAAMDPDFVQPPEQSVKMAVIVVSTVPIMCVYPFLQKYFVKGVMVGALKG